MKKRSFPVSTLSYELKSSIIEKLDVHEALKLLGTDKFSRSFILHNGPFPSDVEQIEVEAYFSEDSGKNLACHEFRLIIETQASRWLFDIIEKRRSFKKITSCRKVIFQWIDPDHGGIIEVTDMNQDVPRILSKVLPSLKVVSELRLFTDGQLFARPLFEDTHFQVDDTFVLHPSNSRSFTDAYLDNLLATTLKNCNKIVLMAYATDFFPALSKAQIENLEIETYFDVTNSRFSLIEEVYKNGIPSAHPFPTLRIEGPDDRGHTQSTIDRFKALTGNSVKLYMPGDPIPEPPKRNAKSVLEFTRQIDVRRQCRYVLDCTNGQLVFTATYTPIEPSDAK